MRADTIFRRLTALGLSCLLLCGALPLPYALAAPEDGVTADTPAVDTGTPDAADTAGTVMSSPLEDPKIEATAAMLINPDTNMVLYEKNADEKRYPASITKVMTALLTLEQVSDLNETVTCTEEDWAEITADSSNADIKVGEQVKVIDLLYALMLPSANEAAYMLARHVGGTSEAFVDMMNTRAAELGCTGTHFSNPCGLHEDDHYSTARDLLKITQAAMQDETFVTIANTAQKTISATNMHAERKLYTTNQLIFSSYQPWYYAYCKGIKTGHTSQAGNCLVSYAEKGKARLFAIVLGCEDAPDSSSVAKSFTETKRLFEWGYENFVSKTLAKRGDEIMRIDVRLSTDTDELILTAKTDLVASIPRNLAVEDLDTVSTTPASKDAPIKAGEVIGSQTYSKDGVEYGTVELIALNDVELSLVLYYADKLENFFKSTAFKIVLAVLAVFVVLYILLNLFLGSMRRRNQRRNMRSRYENTNYQRRRRR